MASPGIAIWLLLQLVSFAAGQVLATSTPLLLPSAVAFDTDGNFYIAETAHHVIRKVDTLGRITTVAGAGTQGFSGDDSQATSALLDSPEGLAVSATALYIADTHNHRVRKVDFATGKITTIAGSSAAGASGDRGPATSATLDRPVALALNAKGDLFIADAGSHRIRCIDANTGVMNTIAGSGVEGYDGDHTDATTALLDSPQGIAVDAKGNIYVADTHNHRIRHIDVTTGLITTVAGTGAFGFAGDAGASTQATLALPRGVTVDAAGNVFVADLANHRIRRIDGTTGVITTSAGDGTQGFAGDGGTAVSASLDSPRAVTIPPSGTFAFADAANRRIRQVSGTIVQTIAGPGSLSPVTIDVSGESEIVYGSGSLTAMIHSATAVSGTIKFIEQADSNVLSQEAVLQNTAIVDLSSLTAGVHTILAAYSGDISHSASLSAGFSVQVDPRPITVIVSPASISYGEVVPSLAGSLSGILANDQAGVSATYNVALPMLPDAGTYPVHVTLSGPSAGNYTVAMGPTLTITRAVTATTLTATTASLVSASSVDAGQPVLMKAHVAASSGGSPTGTVIITDGATLLTAGTPDRSGALSFATSSLGVGPHNLTASYSGDGNFQPSRSPTALFLVSAPPSGPVDFVLAPSSATTQTINSGDSTNFSFLVNVQGSLSGPVTLSASGLPDLATASFNPGSVVPGSPSTPVTMTIATVRTAQNRVNRSTAVFVCLLIGLLPVVRGKRVPVRLLVLGLGLLLPCMVGCGDRIRSGGSIPATTKSYAITVTGSCVGSNGSLLRHTANVTLIVQSAS
jgi:sugar lactone lactonase YvrE